MHDDGLETDRAQQHDVFGERGGQGRVDHRVAAELHDDDGAPEALDVGQRLDERPGPLLGANPRSGSWSMSVMSGTPR